MSTVPDSRLRAALEPLLAVAVGVALTALAFHPGLMSVDSAVQYAQARGALPSDDVHPPLMMLMWRALDAIVSGPALLFLTFATAWWGALAALVWQAWRARAARWTVLFVLGLWPATFLMLGHLWKDVAMAAALLGASAAVLAWHRRHQWHWFALALVLLAAACGFRHNGLAAALPLLLWLCWPLRAHRIALALAASVTLALWPGLLQRAVGATAVQPWSVVALWDLAAISLQVEQVLIPPAMQRHPVTLPLLHDGYRPYANPPLYASGAIRLSFYEPLDADEQHALWQAWWAAIRAHPSAYLSHRAQLARYLFLGFPADVPRELVYVPMRLSLPEAPLTLPPIDETSPLWRAAAVLRPSPLFYGALYLALALLAAAVAWRRSAPPYRGAVLALAASAFGNALPLLVISGSAEFRYLAWSAIASLYAVVCAGFGPRREPGIG